MGLAVYNSIILDIRFPPICYKKLLSPAVVPYNDPQATVGVAKVTLQDLKQTNPVSPSLVLLFFSTQFQNEGAGSHHHNRSTLLLLLHHPNRAANSGAERVGIPSPLLSLERERKGIPLPPCLEFCFALYIK